VCRSEAPIGESLKRKISDLCDVPVEAVVNAADSDNIYEIPLVLHEEGLDKVVCSLLRFEGPEHVPDLTSWRKLVARVDEAADPVRVGIVGKYVSLPDAYLSVVEALKHGAIHHGAAVEIDWVQAEDVEGLLVDGQLRHLDGIVIPGGFGERGIEGKVAAAAYARENGIPCLGLCLGMQVMVIEFSRNVCGLTGANSSEFDPRSPHRVIDLMDSQREVEEKGGTMRLGAYPARLEPDTLVGQAYGTEVIYERHRHRFEFNPNYRSRMEEHGLVCSGSSPDGRLVEFIELPSHPFWVGTQAHPEFKSRPDRAHPLFRELMRAATARAEGRRPRLLEVDRATAEVD
jgi:CTP synthase